MRRITWVVVGLLAAVGVAPAQAQQGTIVGEVRDQATGSPLVGAQVVVVGTSRGAVVNQDGRYIIQGVPAGEQEVRASRLGYSQQTATVTVQGGETVTQNFQLSESAIELGAVVVSATGSRQAVREIGSSVGVVNVEDVELGPVATFSDLLQGRSAGSVVMNTSGTSGSGSRIRIRGSNSISLSNAPLLVIDGVRVDNSTNILSFGTGGQDISALDDLNPEDIESIEILKGPAASALYGTAAANGVIQVTTKTGRAGAAEFRVWAETGQLERGTKFPDNVAVVDADGNKCTVLYQAEGLCTPTQTYRVNPLEGDTTTVFDGGSRTTYGASISGGSDEATFYLSAERTDEESVYDSDNYVERINLQANVTGAVGQTLRVRGTVGYADTDIQFPLSDNALFGAIGMGIFGDATPGLVAATGGYENDIAFHYEWQTWQRSDRLVTSASADWRPLDWLSINGTTGLERINRQGEGRIPRVSEYGVFGGIYSDGWIQLQEVGTSNLNANVGGSAVFNLTPDVVSTTTLGTAYIREDVNGIYSFGATLIPGIETSLAGATTDFSASEFNVLNATLSAYAQQRLAWRNRIYLNGAVRGDQNTAFGTDIGWIWYPSVSGSWVISEEDFFPRGGFLNELRLRGAYGQSGLRPGATDALLSFSGNVATYQDVDVPAITIDELGNTELVPERSSEYEIGFEAGLLDNRFGVEATYYSKTSTDALVNRPLPPSPGGSNSRFENLGEVSNKGFEFLVNGDLLRTDNFGWGFSVSGSWNDNKLVDLGEDAQGNPIPPIGSGSQRYVEGYPLGGWWQIPIYSFEDTNGDGLLQISEVDMGVCPEPGGECLATELDADSVSFHGDALPTREFTFHTSFDLGRLVRVSALFDHKGGHKILNYSRAWRAVYETNSEEAYDQDLSLEGQAGIIALATTGSYTGFMEDADFWKFRELSVSFRVPDQYTSLFRASNLRLTFAGRNLATWTNYTGLDPEVSWGGTANFTSGDFATLPPNRSLSIRVDANF